MTASLPLKLCVLWQSVHGFFLAVACVEEGTAAQLAGCESVNLGYTSLLPKRCTTIQTFQAI